MAPPLVSREAQSHQHSRRRSSGIAPDSPTSSSTTSDVHFHDEEETPATVVHGQKPSLGYFNMPEDGRLESPTSLRSNSLSIQIPPSPTTTSMAFAAMQYLPTPLLVLSSDKTVILANEAMARLLCIDLEDALERQGGRPGEVLSATDVLYGLTLRQMGIDMLQGGSPVWIAWEEFLDGILKEAQRPPATENGTQSHDSSAGIAKTESEAEKHTNGSRRRFSMRQSPWTSTRTTLYDVSIDVAISPDNDGGKGKPQSSLKTRRAADEAAISANMIVTVWQLEDSHYFTLSFTSSGIPVVSPNSTRTSSRTVLRQHSIITPSPSSTSSSSSSGRRSLPSSVSSPTVTFPPHGPPTSASKPDQPSVLQKASRLKDAILNSMNLPAYALWKDESLGMPNKALLALQTEFPDTEPVDQRDFLSRFKLWDETFTRQLDIDDFPIMQLVRRRERFEAQRIGMRDPRTGSKIVFEATGEAVTDCKTNEFLGGLVVFKDITEYTDRIASQMRETERQFECIANSIPPMVWTTTPDGTHDWYSQRWYDYTGLSHEASFGEGWQLAFHEDDMPATTERWLNSLATGQNYHTEYRCKSKDGEWRWMLGQASPFRDEQGNLTRWFGTCTDIHELVEAREAARQMREQLLTVLEHSQVTLWAVDRNRDITLFEGDLTSARMHPRVAHMAGSLVGKNIYELFATSEGDDSQDPEKKVRAEQWYQHPIEKILAGELQQDIREVFIPETGRWLRARLVPIKRQERNGGIDGDVVIDGVMGVTMDVTDAKARETELRTQEEENSRLLANAAAAKEASRMKSQFLANMSHEIRTPIAGVIGMSELLLDTTLDDEQQECAENIQRSANGLLTVINDILDFSKVESGRLDIEEVQFSLSVVIRDVNKMLSFAAERKNLRFESDVNLSGGDLKVMGDPGRVRQILTNLLTNSIKFTTEGKVRLAAWVQSESQDTITVKFVVEDTGIGIEEEVRKRLFKPFSQADSSTARRFGGTGLGLTICKNLVELMRGQIALDSNLGQGTKATFWIPFSRGPYQNNSSGLVDIGPISERLQSDISLSCGTSGDRTPPVSTPAHQGLHGRNSSITVAPGTPPSVTPYKEPTLNADERKDIHILVVEDNQINQQIAIKTIKKLGFSVSAVWNGKEALEYLEASKATSNFTKDTPSDPNHRPPDIILMDVQMPILDGYRATHMIRHKLPFSNSIRLQNTPIVAMTASAIQGDREKCQKAGMDDYLAKPVKGKVLEKMLVKWAVKNRIKREQESQPNPEPRLEKVSSLKTERSNSAVSYGSLSDFSPTTTPEVEHPPTFDLLRVRPRPGPHTSSSSTATTVGRQPETKRLPSDGSVNNANHTDLASSPATDDDENVSQKLARIHFENSNTLNRSTETEDASVWRRVREEEQATSLRDDKLLALTSEDGRPPGATSRSTSDTTVPRVSDHFEKPASRSPSTPQQHAVDSVQRFKVNVTRPPASPSPHALTEENMHTLAAYQRQKQPAPTDGGGRQKPIPSLGQSSSMDVETHNSLASETTGSSPANDGTPSKTAADANPKRPKFRDREKTIVGPTRS